MKRWSRLNALFCYSAAYWSQSKNQIEFRNCFLKARGRHYEVNGQKNIVPKDYKLYLCKIAVTTGDKSDETFKLMVLSDDTISNFKEENIQLVGSNVNGNFMIDPSFLESCRRVGANDSISKISLAGERLVAGKFGDDI